MTRLNPSRASGLKECLDPFVVERLDHAADCKMLIISCQLSVIARTGHYYLAATYAQRIIHIMSNAYPDTLTC